MFLYNPNVFVLMISGPFVDWYRENIMNENIQEIRMKELEAKEKAEQAAKEEEEARLPEVKIG